MPWNPAEDIKPPYQFDQDEIEKEIDKKKVEEIKQNFAKELLEGQTKPSKVPKKKPNEVIFDSKKGYKK